MALLHPCALIPSRCFSLRLLLAMLATLAPDAPCGRAASNKLRFARGAICKHRTASLRSAGGVACSAPLAGCAFLFIAPGVSASTAQRRFAPLVALLADTPSAIGSLRSAFLAVGCLYNARYARVKHTPHRSGCAFQ